jgi:hypothetical protein
MPASVNYKLAKISAPYHVQRTIFEVPGESPGETIARAILKNPRAKRGPNMLAIFNAAWLDRSILEGDFVRGSLLEWPHIAEGQLKSEVLPAATHCHFFYNRITQVAAFQSTRISKSLPAMLRDWDELLGPHVLEFGREVRSLPLNDETPFLRALEQARAVKSITFHMIPPNGYTRPQAQRTMAYISEAVGAREIAIKMDAARSGTIRHDAPAVGDLAAECAEGNGIARAPIVDADGNARTVTTRSAAPVIKQLRKKTVAGVRKMLQWAETKVRS